VVETKMAARPMGRRPPSKWTGGKFAPKRKVCSFCASRGKGIDYKDTGMLGRFISDRGKIEPRRRTGTCNRHQHSLALAIKQARHVALLPFVPEHIHMQGLVPPLNLNPGAVENKTVVETKPMVDNIQAIPSVETEASA
jgi:small subunit ribosomal protein S18